MIKFDAVGLIVNPFSGQGARRNLRIARQVVEALGAREVITGPADLGANALPWARVSSPPEPTGRAATQWLAQEAARQEVDAVIVVGGDGTMADVASALLQLETRPPILGVGAGSINAGDLVSCTAAEVENSVLESAHWALQDVHALVAGCNGQEMALAFNDVVIGTTIVGTLHGQVTDLDAAAHLAGVRTAGLPRSVAAPSASVVKVAGDARLEVARGSLVGTVIAGFAHPDRFYGKAIVGGVCLTSVAGLPAGCLVCEQPLVRTQLDPAELAAVEPVRSAYCSLTVAEQIEVSGLGPPAVFCADGNPLKALQPADRVEIRLLRDQIPTLRIVT